MSEALPARANLDYLKKVCKQRAKALRAEGKSVKLAFVQRDIARRYGFKSWNKLREHVQRGEHVQSQTAGTGDADLFLQAVAEGDFAAVQRMVKKTPSLMQTRGKHPTWGGRPLPLHVAIERNRPEIFDFFLRSGADVNGDCTTEYGGWSALMLSVHWKRDAMRDALLAAGAKRGLLELLLLQDDAGVTQLLAQNPDAAKTALPGGQTPLFFARTAQAAELLLHAGVNPVIKDNTGKTALDAIAGRGEDSKGALEVLRRHTPLDAIMLAPTGDMAGLTSLLTANPAALSEMKNGAPIGVRALHAAAEHNQVAVIRWLLAHGVPVNGTTERNITALHGAAWVGQLQAAMALVEAGADLHARDTEHNTTPEVWGRTAEQMFGRTGSKAVADFLAAKARGGQMTDGDAALDQLVWPANLATRDATEARGLWRTQPQLAKQSIYLAAAMGDAEALRTWLKQDRTLATKPGGVRNWVPLLYVCFSRLLASENSKTRRAAFATCAKLLLEAGADANSSFTNPADNVRESALYGASGAANDPGVTKLLLKHGADVNDGETTYHTAEFKDHACLKLILAKKPADIHFCLCHKMDMEDPAGVRVFLQHGADPNYVIDRGSLDLRGMRPLHFAILRGRSVAVIKELLRGGADATLTDARGITPLAYAMRLGRKEVGAYLADKTKETISPRERFFAACSGGEEKLARKLLAQMPTLVKEMDAHDAALLPAAAGDGRLSAVKLMLDLGFPIEAVGNWGGTALHQAAWPGHVAVVKLLLERGARIDTKQQWGGDALATAIHGAVHGRHTNGPEVVRLIAAATKVGDWQRYLEQAKKEGAKEIIPVLETLIRSASDDPAIKALPEHRRTHKIASWKPIMDAAFAGDAARIRKLLKEGADPNVVSTTPSRYRPLHRAVEFKKTDSRGTRHVEAVRALLEGGADPHLRGGWEMMTALGQAGIGEVRFVEILRPRFEPLDIFHAALMGEESRVAALLKQDQALAREKDANNWTPLHYAASSALLGEDGDGKALLGIARRLIDAGADVAAAYLWEEKWPIPVLYGCCGRHDFPEMAELLIKAGASACDGESVYHAADEGHDGALAVIERLTPPKKLATECTWSLAGTLHWGHTRGMKWFLEHGADPNALYERFGNSALHEAAARGAAEKVIALLLKYGADPKRKNKAGKTAIEVAKAAGHGRVVKQLGG